MDKLTFFVLFLFCIPLTAQKMFLYPKAAVAPRGSYQSVTAILTGVNDKTVTWSTSGGKIVGTNPCVANEPCSIALFSTEAGKYTLTATSNANHSVTAVAAVTFTASPTPVTTHPRLILTADMLPHLRAKATPKNVMYRSLKVAAEATLQHDGTIWRWSCQGGTGQPGSDQAKSYKEGDAYQFAVMSEIAPTQKERDQWGCYGRDVFMTNIGYVISGSVDLTQGNRWADGALQWAFTADYLMGGGYLSASDEVVVRQYLAKLAYEQINDIYNGTLAKVGGYNSPAQLDEADENSTTNMRAMGNNYTQARILLLTAAALTFNDDATDDPPLANTCSATRYQVCPDGTAGSLHAYWSYVTGGMLYKDWANLEDGAVVQQAYNAAYSNLPAQPQCNTLWHTAVPCLGGGRGGESNEGTSYGSSVAKLRWAMNAIQTAGYDDPLKYGPQLSLGTMSYWDLRYVADLTLLTGLSGAPAGAIGSGGWNFLTDGDTLYYFPYPSNYAGEAGMLSADANVGRTDRSAALEWLLTNTAFGMATGKAGGCAFYCGVDGELSNDFASTVALDMFIALPAEDPSSSHAPADPRTSLPLDWYDAGNQHIVARDGWGTGTNTIFSYYCTNTEIDHEHEYCGGFSIYANGEYITKGRTEFNDYNNEMSTARNQNVPAYINNPSQTSCTFSGCYFADAAEDGGQLWHGYEAGLDTLYHAELPGYVATVADMTNSYNGGWGGFSELNGITGASRSMVYLRGSHQVVYYDRGDSGSNAWDKANYLVTTGTPSFSGNTATWLTRSGSQRVYWTELEPSANAPQLDTTYTDGDASNDWEIYGRLKVDAGAVKSARFLSVLAWGPASLANPSATRVASSAGTPFEGTVVGSSLVMFLRDWPTIFTSVTYPASGATTQYVSDLAPNTAYTISAAGAPTSATTDNAGLLTFNASGAGDVTVSALPGSKADAGLSHGDSAGRSHYGSITHHVGARHMVLALIAIMEISAIFA